MLLMFWMLLQYKKLKQNEEHHVLEEQDGIQKQGYVYQ